MNRIFPVVAAAYIAFALSACGGAPKRPRVVLNALNAAANNGDSAGVSAALAAGADPCAVDADGMNAVSRLLYHGGRVADALMPAAVEKGCPEALKFAVSLGRKEDVRALLARGMPVKGGHPLLVSVAAGVPGANDERPIDVEVARMLLDAGADPNESLSGGYGPLFYAIANRRAGVAKLLIESGADVNAKGYQDSSLLVEAINHGQPALVRLMIQKGADPEAAITQLERNVMYWQNETAKPYGGLYAQNNLQASRNSLARLQRLADEARTPAAAAPGGVTKEELAGLVQAAVEKAAAKPAAAPVKRYASAADKPAYSRPERPEDFAVVVGISKYSDLPEAAHAERDAEAVKDHLIAAGFPSRNVVLLSGEKASRSAIEKFVETWLPRNAGPGSRVAFYFSGHGAPDPVKGDAYLVPWDGDPGFLENTAYPLARLYAKLGALPAREVLVALDACFSGTGGRSVLAKGARPLVARAGAAARPEKLTVLAAASGDEIASTAEDQGHGLFTYHLLTALNAAGGAGRPLGARGAHAELMTKVQDAARRQNRSQTPTVAGPDFELLR